MEQYDAIIIGAGIAGLTSAAYLAQAGVHVLVCEHSDQPGGYFNSFRRDGYLFDGGIKAIENAGIMRPTLAQLGLLDAVRLMPSPIALITQSNVQPIRSPADIDAYFGLMMDLFPDQRSGLVRVLADVQSITTALTALVRLSSASFAATPEEARHMTGGFRQNMGALARVPSVMALSRGTLRGYLEKHLSDPHLVNLLCDVFPDGTTPLFGLAYYSLFLDYYYPEGGMQAVPDALAHYIRDKGGDILLNADVQQITMASGSATGVVLADGRAFRAGHVIACGDARRTFTRLLPEGSLPERFLAPMLRAQPSHSVFTVFLGVNVPADQLGLKGCPHVFYAPDLAGIEGTDRLQTDDYFSRVPQEISVPSLLQPDLAPPGKSGIILSALTTWHYADHWGTVDGQATARTEELRNKFAGQMVSSLARLIPALEDHVELRFTSTPYSMQARTLNDKGAIVGWSYEQHATWSRGGLLSIAKSVRTPVPNLLMAGHWAFSPGGSPVAVLTGKLAASSILKSRGGAERT
ncbi:MAG: phytoene desaturase family protein [Candidatus Cryosericum sp.]